VSALGHPVAFALLDTREGRRAERIARTLADVHAQWDLVHAGGAEAPTAHEILWSAWQGLGVERAWVAAAEGSGPLAAQSGRELDALVALFQAAKRHGERADGTSPGAFLRGILDSDVAEDRLADDSTADAVDILTPAGAVGARVRHRRGRGRPGGRLAEPPRAGEPVADLAAGSTRRRRSARCHRDTRSATRRAARRVAAVRPRLLPCAPTTRRDRGRR
jgi:hypothetical protein